MKRAPDPFILFAAYVAFLVVLALLLVFFPSPAAAELPRAALQHRADLTREARLAWGLSAPVADFAGQIHQESGWRADAVSRVGARGMAQFMPATARWWCEINGLTDAACAPMSPRWALRALTGYDRWLWDRIPGAADDCERMAMTLSAYNGGLRWVQRDRALAQSLGLDPGRYWGSVETVNAGRAKWAIEENRDYPRRILTRHAPRYAAAGWGGSTCP